MTLFKKNIFKYRSISVQYAEELLGSDSWNDRHRIAYGNSKFK